ncbi:MAG: DUF1579 domain-containing protein [Gemmatales bacterium]
MIRLIAILAACLVCGSIVAQEGPGAPPGKEQVWLKQFVGEWETSAEAIMAPGQPSMKCTGTASNRMLGNWMVSETKTTAMGSTVTGLQTIGYHLDSKKFVGTWIDSMNNHLWHYKGSLDATGKILTLDAEGPNFTQPGKMSSFQDIYEFKSADHYIITSKIKGDDGKWITFMTGDVKRKK